MFPVSIRGALQQGVRLAEWMKDQLQLRRDVLKSLNSEESRLREGIFIAAVASDSLAGGATMDLTAVPLDRVGWHWGDRRTSRVTGRP